ncbi:MAG: polysaccharide pyruvyl transferase CsaB [Romboutsia timonensis]|uniref:polysaccharide pyruvyl transferase CsaB n=1 Tax=Romboutsia timonensis TaxID=1776391 RepID=UPI002A753FF3|nr:polysaccharide pyruvyl transferase CsaB [Romboutsia timonensis]MDY3002799.1 polysaccharide pyruvyl transferase CsaB [Romboutsia timonensis]
MKVLISGYYGFYNIGDEAILKSIIEALRNEDPNIDIVVLSNDVDYTKSTYKVDAINRWKLNDIYKELLKCDGLISGGGSLFQDVTSSRSILYYTGIIWLAKLAKKPIFIYAQGVGPINKKNNRRIVGKFFNKVDYITLRDKESKLLLNSIGVRKDIDIVPDPVMGFNIENYEFKLTKYYTKDDYITVSIRDWKKNNSEFQKNIALTCDKIVESGINVVFIPMHGQYDETISKQVASLMRHNATVLSKDLTMEEKMMYIKESKLMIGMRLHALIFAATVGTPMIGISYDPKIDSYLKLIEQPSIGNVDTGWSPLELTNMALDIISNYETEKIMLENKTFKLRSLAPYTAKKALETFKRKID